MGPLKKLMAQVATYGVSSILTRTINFLLVPLYTAALTPESYGVVSYLYALAAFLNVLFTWGLETAYFRKAGLEPEKERNHFATAQQLLLLCNIPLWIVLIWGTPLLAESTIIQHPKYVYLLVAIVATDALLALPFARLRLLGMVNRFVLLKSAQVGITLLLNVWWVYVPFAYQIEPPLGLHLLDDLERILVANLLAIGLVSLPLGGSLINITQPVRLYESASLIRYGFPLMLMGMAGMVNEVLDRMLLEVWLPPGFYSELSTAAAIGIYSGCYKLSIIITLGIQAFRYAVEPYFFKQAAQQDAPLQYARIMHLYMIAASFAMLAVMLHLDVLKYLLRQDIYHQGLHILVWLLPANVLLGVYYNLSVWYKVTDKTYFGMIFSFAGAGLTCAANYVLIPLAGFEGSAIATLCCYTSMALMSYYLGKKQMNIPYNLTRVLLYLVSAWIAGYLFIHFKEDTLLWNIPIAWITLGAWAFWVWWLERSRLAK